MPSLQIAPAVPTFGEKLGEALERAGGALAQGYAKRLENQQTQNVFQTLNNPNISPIQKIMAISSLPAEKQRYLGRPLAAVLGPQAQAEAENLQLQNFLGNNFQQGISPQLMLQQTPLSQIQQAVPKNFPEQTQNTISQQETPVAQQQVQQQLNTQHNPNDITTWPDQDVTQLAARSGVLGRLGQEELKRRREEQRQETESFKTTKEYREKLLDAYEGSKSTIASLDRMSELNKNEKLTAPALAALSERFNIPISVLSNSASEEFQKLSQNLMKDIRNYYGARINIVEVQNFLKSIPTLLNSKEGRDRIIKNMKILLVPNELAYKAYQDIRKKGGKLPLDLHEQVLEKMEPELNKLADKFKENASVTVVGVDPNGVRRQIPRDRLKEFEAAGGTLE